MANKKLIVLAISSALMMGCNGSSDSSEPIQPPPVVDPEITPPIDPETPDILPPVDPVIPSATGVFSLNGDMNFGASVICNDSPATEFVIKHGDTIVCSFENIELATFTDVQLQTTKSGSKEKN